MQPKSRDAKTTRRNFTNAIRDEQKANDANFFCLKIRNSARRDTI